MGDISEYERGLRGCCSAAQSCSPLRLIAEQALTSTDCKLQAHVHVMLRLKSAASAGARKHAAAPVQVQEEAAEALAVASSLGAEEDDVDLAAIAEDLPRLQQVQLRQWQTVKDCERQMSKIKEARTISGGGTGGGRRTKKEDAAYKVLLKA